MGRPAIRLARGRNLPCGDPAGVGVGLGRHASRPANLTLLAAPYVGPKLGHDHPAAADGTLRAEAETPDPTGRGTRHRRDRPRDPSRGTDRHGSLDRAPASHAVLANP